MEEGRCGGGRGLVRLEVLMRLKNYSSWST